MTEKYLDLDNLMVEEVLKRLLTQVTGDNYEVKIMRNEEELEPSKHAINRKAIEIIMFLNKNQTVETGFYYKLVISENNEMEA